MPGTPNMTGVGAGQSGFTTPRAPTLPSSRSFPTQQPENLTSSGSVQLQRSIEDDTQTSTTDDFADTGDLLAMVRQLKAESKDEILDTLDLCHQQIETVPPELLSLIKGQVVRLALGYNSITQLPDTFANLDSLRYLNVRANNISTFPTCLCNMPNLEILDLSRNKLTALPQEPGRLLSLRILSINGNRLVQLPAWVSQMKQLRILKLDNNPLEWPPPHISKMPVVNLPKPTSTSDIGALAERDKAKRFEDRQMIVWIAKLRSWINDPANALVSNDPATDAPTQQEPTKVQVSKSELLALNVEAPSQSMGRSRLPPLTTSITAKESATKLLPSLIPASEDSEASMISGDSSSGDSTGGATSSTSNLTHNPPLASPFESKLPLALPSMSPQTTGPGDVNCHTRNSSHSVLLQSSTQQQLESRQKLSGKKSLPDLRLSQTDTPVPTQAPIVKQEEIAGKVPSVPSQQSLATPPPIAASRRASRPAPNGVAMQQTRSTPGSGSTDLVQTPSSIQMLPPNVSGGGLRKLSLPTVGATKAAAEAASAAFASRSQHANGSTPPRIDNNHVRMPSDRADTNWTSNTASPMGIVARNPADQERNSYFRRLSTLPPSNVAKAVPAPVLKFVDGTRGVLFALSQIHAAISQFMTPVIDERISGQFHRVLDISNGSIVSLINSLDRFDSLSRRGTPDPSVIRGVLTTCKESVITFRKLVSVLQLQLRALQSSSDVRYARTLLLMLVGSMAEVCNSWTAMAPLVEAVQPYLTQQQQGVVATAPAPTATLSHPSARSGSIGIKGSNSSSTPSLPSIAESTAPLRSAVRSAAGTAGSKGPSRRRHAGSFSAHDVAQGAAMAPNTGFTPPFNLDSLQAASGYTAPTKSTRGPAFQRFESMPNVVLSDSAAVRSTASGPSTPARPTRSGSNASSVVAESTTPRSQPGSVSVPQAGHRLKASVSGNDADITPAQESKIVVDDHLLGMVDQITQLSGQVWSMLFTHLRAHGVDAGSAPNSVSSGDEEVRELNLSDAGAKKQDSKKIDATLTKLHELRETAHTTDELTMQLRSTYLVVRQMEDRATQHERTSSNSSSEPNTTGDVESKQRAIAKLFDQSHQFVRAIVATSTVMKSISETEAHEFPRDLRRSLGEIAQACSNLTVYLLWLSPPV